MAQLGRPRGSKNAERIKSAELQSCLEILRELNVDEAAVVRAVATERIAEASGFEDRPSAPRERWILALSEADLLKRETTGEGLKQMKDYEAFRPDWGPSLSGLYGVFGGWRHALDEAGLLNVVQPETHLGIADGRPKGGGTAWTEEDDLRLIALCYERMRGRRFSWGALEDFCRSTTRKLPGITRLCQGPNARPLAEWLDLGAEYILEQGPGAYPRAYDYLSRSRDVREQEKAA